MLAEFTDEDFANLSAGSLQVVRRSQYCSEPAQRSSPQTARMLLTAAEFHFLLRNRELAGGRPETRDKAEVRFVPAAGIAGGTLFYVQRERAKRTLPTGHSRLKCGGQLQKSGKLAPASDPVLCMRRPDWSWGPGTRGFRALSYRRLNIITNNSGFKTKVVCYSIIITTN